MVTSTRLKDVEEEASRIPGKVIVITAEDIQKLGAKTVQEVLQYQSGVILYDQIGNEFQSTVDLRGFNGQPVPVTSVFVDGVRVNEPDFNTVNFDVIPIENIDKIEILYGPGTVFGRNALGGVLNITTKRGRSDTPHIGLEVGGGSFGRQKYHLNTDGPLPLPNFDYYFGLTRELTNGFRDETGGRITRLFGKLGYRPGQDTDVALSYTHVQDHLKQAGSLPPEIFRRDSSGNLTPGDFSDSDLHMVSLNLRQKLPAGFSLALNGFVRDNNVESFVVGNFGAFDAHFDYLQGGGALQLSQEGPLFDRKNLANLGVEYGRNLFSNRTSGSFTANKSAQENLAGVYFLDRFDLFESLTLSGGFRYDWDRIDFSDRVTPAFSFLKTFNRISPKGGVSYNPFPSLGFYFGYSEGFRTPTVDEFSAFGPPPAFTPSVTQLDPVKTKNFELGARWRMASWLEGSLAVFYMPVRDEILFIVTDPLTFTGRNENVDRTLRKGIEVTLKGRYGELMDAFLNYTLTKASFETDVLLFSGQVKRGDELPLVPRHRIGIGANFHPLDKLTISLFGNYVGRQFSLNDEPNRLKKLQDYFVLNGKVAYTWRNLTGFVTLNNLTNRKYATFGIIGSRPPLFNPEPFRVPAPGINAFAGIIFRY